MCVCIVLKTIEGCSIHGPNIPLGKFTNITSPLTLIKSLQVIQVKYIRKGKIEKLLVCLLAYLGSRE